jgi:spore coat polysaccharide biosynthesis protein SpsF
MSNKLQKIIPKLIIVQARTGSTRLPNKILKNLGGKNVLTVLMERLEKTEEPDGVVIATTNLPEDDVIVELCKKNQWTYFRGSTLDLLDRHYQCAKFFSAEIVSKIPSDTPFNDPKIIDSVFRKYNEGGFDYVSNLHPPTFPGGFDCEVFSFSALEESWKNAKKNYEREHTTGYIWDNPDKFRIGNMSSKTGIDYSMRFRCQVDYIEDLQVVREIFNELYLDDPTFSFYELVEFLDRHESISDMNKKHIGINWYRNHLDELNNVDKSWTRTND